MQPINSNSYPRLFEIKQARNTHQRQSGSQNDEPPHKYTVTDVNCPPITTPKSQSQMKYAKGDKWHNEEQANRQMQTEHPQEEQVLVTLALNPGQQ